MSDVRLLHGEALETLRGLPDGSIGHVVTDPPYGQTNESYESGIAFDPELWRECHRVTGPNAALISFAGSPTYHKIATAIEAGGWKVRQMWGWVYRNGFITSAYPKEGFDRLAPAMDPIVFATKGKVLLNLEREGTPWNDGRSCRTNGYSERSVGVQHDARSEKGHWPRTLTVEAGISDLQYFVLSPNSVALKSERVGHPNQKPLALMRWLVSKLPKGDRVTCRDCDGRGRPGWPECVVATQCLYCHGKGYLLSPPRPILDPFAGSATTLEAARIEGFDATGIERDPAYHAMGDARLRAALPLFAREVPA